ncbi:MAG: YkgJ family cysteine cluster protein [Acidobacteria bacterium]|jgi:Fe-S-cluster containining protein|nr:YkgJ family cysteine cluster protein [Acidobacteriota bacterium]
MLIEQKIKEIKKIYRIIDADVLRFKKFTGLKCLRYCSHCCENPYVTATVLEFLPLAYELYQQNHCEEYLEKIKQAETGDMEDCFLLHYPPNRENSGRCLTYKYRPLVCRLFGFSVVLDKNNLRQLVTCSGIKQKYHENYEQTVHSLETIPEAPVMKNYYMMLYGIDTGLAQKYYSLYTALEMAIETVMSAFAYV